MTERISEDKKDQRELIERIEDEIAEKTVDIKKLSDELDEIHSMKRKSDQIHEEVLESWKGEEGFKILYEAREEVNSIFNSLIQNTENAIEETEAEKKRLIREIEDIS